MDLLRPGLTAPISTATVHARTTTTTSSTAAHLPLHHSSSASAANQLSSSTAAAAAAAASSAPPSRSMGEYAELHLAPATRQTVITTTTTTTVHFAPILLPRSTRPSLASSSATNAPLSPTAAFTQFARDQEQQHQHLQLDPKLYPLSQSKWPGGLRKFRIALGSMEGTFEEAGAPDEDALELETEGRSPMQALAKEGNAVAAATSSKGKGRAETNANPLGTTSTGRSAVERASHAHRKKPRRSHTGPGAAFAVTAAIDSMEVGVARSAALEIDDDAMDSTMRITSPGPPRKRPRAGTSSQQQYSRSNSVESEMDLEIDLSTTTLEKNALPSPNLSPASSAKSILGSDDAAGAAMDEMAGFDAEQREATVAAAAVTVKAGLEGEEHDQRYDLGSGHALSSLLSLPDFVNTFDQLPPALQSYFIFTFLKRSSVPVLQTINNIIAPSLRRDFLTDLPPELGIQILGYLDVKPLCRASVVCRGWRGLVDGEWRVWKERLVADGLWIGDGSEANELAEMKVGSKESLFLQRWEAGVWDNNNKLSSRSRGTSSHKRHPDEMVIDTTSESLRRPSASHAVNLASPSSSRDNSPMPASFPHYIHPYKKLYRRRFITRRNWVENEPERITFPCHANSVVTCLQFDKDKIVSASDDQSINVFNTRSGETKARLNGHEGGVWALQYIGNILVSGSTDRTVRVWDLEKGKCTHVFVGHTSTVRCLQIVEPENVQTDPTGDPIWEPPYPLIVTGSRDWSLRVWRLPSPDRDNEYHPEVPMSPTEENTDPSDNPFHLRHLVGHRHAVRALAASGKTLVSGSYDCTVRVWNMLTGECKHKLTGHSQKVYSVVYDPLRKQCASGSMDGTVKLWSTESGENLATLEGHTSLVGLLGLSFQHLVSAAADSTLRVWDPATGDLRNTLAAHSGAITCFQHDEYKVISGSDGTLKMWDVRTGTFIRDLLTGLTGVWQVSFDHRFCVAAVQRNGQSEFEILDFGGSETNDVETGERKDRLDAIEEDSLKLDLTESIADDDDGVGDGGGSSRDVGLLGGLRFEGSNNCLETLTAAGGTTSSPRIVRRVASSINLQQANPTVVQSSSPATSDGSIALVAAAASYRSRISAAAPPSQRPNAFDQSEHLDDPFAASTHTSRTGSAAMEVEDDD